MPLSFLSLRNFCSMDQRVLRRASRIEGFLRKEKDTIVIYCTYTELPSTVLQIRVFVV